jgi:large subunit ribosomal protein L3
MASYNAPRKGSMAFYPRVRSRKETPSIKASGNEIKALSFLAYKVGMTQVLGKNNHKGSPGFGQEVLLPATIIECPPIKVLGIRAYVKDEIGVNVYGDVLTDNFDKELKRKIVRFKEKTTKKTKPEETKTTITDFEKIIDKILYFTLIVYTQPKITTIKKKPDTVEINIGGSKEEQFAYAKEKLGKEITIDEVFKEGTSLDIKAVTKGKGFQGVIKRFGIKIQRPKAKTRRIVGSISPWHPATVMYTVARAGQHGYHNRTEHNKKLLKISDKIEEVNGKTGYSGYGLVKGKYAVIAGSIPGPAKRCIAIRQSQRPANKSGAQIESIEKILVK